MSEIAKQLLDQEKMDWILTISHKTFDVPPSTNDGICCNTLSLLPFHILLLYFLLQTYIQKLFGTIWIFRLYKTIWITDISNGLTKCWNISNETVSFRINNLRATRMIWLLSASSDSRMWLFI